MHAAKVSRSVQAMYLRGTHFSCWCIVVRHGASIWHDENVLSGKSVFTNKSCTNYPSVTIVSRPRFLVCAENVGQRNLYDTVCFKTTPLPTPFFLVAPQDTFYSSGIACSVLSGVHSTIIFVSLVNSNSSLLLLCTKL